MYTLEEKVAIVDLVRCGMTYREASRLIGVPHQTIWEWRQKLDQNYVPIVPWRTLFFFSLWVFSRENLPLTA